MQMEYIQCPMCGWLRPVSYGGRDVRLDKVDVETVKVWQLKELSGAGRGSKQAKIKLIEAKTLKELPEDLKNQILKQCKKIISILES